MIPFLTDNDVDDRVGDLLREAGHEVFRLRQVMPRNAPDPQVAAMCRKAEWVLVTHNIRDFRKIARDHEMSRADALRLHRVELGCDQFRAVERMGAAIGVIEWEWANQADDIPLRVYVGNAVIRIHR